MNLNLNRKKVVWLVLAVILLAIALFFIIFEINRSTVRFELGDNVGSIAISNDNGKNIANLEKSGDLRLNDGAYTVVPSGENVDTTPIYISVSKNNETFNINPGPSLEYLQNQLNSKTGDDSVEKLHALIKARYGQIQFGSFQIDTGRLLNEDWYITAIHQPLKDGEIVADNYKIILHKENGKWQIATEPELILEYAKYPDIPRDVISTANNF